LKTISFARKKKARKCTCHLCHHPQKNPSKQHQTNCWRWKETHQKEVPQKRIHQKKAEPNWESSHDKTQKDERVAHEGRSAETKPDPGNRQNGDIVRSQQSTFAKKNLFQRKEPEESSPAKKWPHLQPEVLATEECMSNRKSMNISSDITHTANSESIRRQTEERSRQKEQASGARI